MFVGTFSLMKEVFYVTMSNALNDSPETAFFHSILENREILNSVLNGSRRAQSKITLSATEFIFEMLVTGVHLIMKHILLITNNHRRGRAVVTIGTVAK